LLVLRVAFAVVGKHNAAISEKTITPIRTRAIVDISVTLRRNHRPIVMEVLKLFWKSNEMALRNWGQDGADSNCIVESRWNLMTYSEHDAPLHGSRKWVVASFGTSDPDTPCQFVHVNGIALGFVFKPRGETSQKPGCCWPKDRKPEHLNVRVAN